MHLCLSHFRDCETLRQSVARCPFAPPPWPRLSRRYVLRHDEHAKAHAPGRMYLNNFGKIVAEEWQRTGELRDEVSLDAFIVMPDHVHGLLWIHHSETASDGKEKPERDDGEAYQSRNGNTKMAPSDGRTPGEEESRDASRDSFDLPPGLQKRRAGTLSTIIGCFKAAVTRRINELRETPGETIWQSSFHDRIVRNRDERRRIRQYIRTNPQRWLRETPD